MLETCRGSESTFWLTQSVFEACEGSESPFCLPQNVLDACTSSKSEESVFNSGKRIGGL